MKKFSISYKYIVIFPSCLKKIHFVKDVLIIPEYLKSARGWKYLLLCKDIADDVSPVECNNCNIEKYKNTFDLVWKIIKYSNNTIVQVYFHNIYTMIITIISKFIVPTNKYIIKSDYNIHTINNINKKKYILINKAFKYIVDYVLVESNVGKMDYSSNYRLKESKIYYLPNGYVQRNNDNLDKIIAQKEKILCVVGRFGARFKGHHILFRALEYLDLNDWQIQLAGTMTRNFKNYYAEFIKKYPHINIMYNGTLSVDELSKLYKKSYAIIHPSINTSYENESFALVLVEAMSWGNYLVVTDAVPSAYDIIQNNDIGSVIEQNNINALVNAINKIIQEKSLNTKRSNYIIRYAKKYEWGNVLIKYPFPSL